jgi:hypothetical protein
VITYTIALFISQLGLNVIYQATVFGLVPDELEAQKLAHSAASGIIGVFHFSGMITGMLFIMVTAKWSVQTVYPVYMVSIFATCAYIWHTVPEKSTVVRECVT